jgi:MoxR-like ATPase
MESVEQIIECLAQQRYLADEGLGVSLYLAIQLGRPLLIEGVPGVGKTEVAKALAASTARRLIRLQCYEGIDVPQALYEWDFGRQMLTLRAGEASSSERTPVDQFFSERFLIERPLLAALRAGSNAVLLIDEIDRADDEFEAFLLEFLAEFQITIPELGTVRAQSQPIVVLTSNRTRDIHDALKRRCLYHWIDYPSHSLECRIIAARAPEVPARLAEEVVSAVFRFRDLELLKPPGVAESIDWARGLKIMGASTLADSVPVERTLGLVLKEKDDITRVRRDGTLQAISGMGR